MNAPLQRHHLDSASLRAYVRDLTGGATVLAFSAGKDAIAAWLALREAGFTKIVPFYQYLVPDLEFVEQGLRYYEDVFETPIVRVPHPSFLRMLENLVYQTPENAGVIERIEIPRLRYQDVNAHIRRVAALPEGFIATGVRSADSPMRYLTIKKHGALNAKERTFLPIFDWKIAEVKDAIMKAGIKLTVDYRLFGRSFDGIDHRFLVPIRDHFPDDYARILQWFPLAELEIMRRHLGQERAG